MLATRFVRLLGLAVIAIFATGAVQARADHDRGNGKSQDNKKRKKPKKPKKHEQAEDVWCLVSDTNVLGDADDYSGLATEEDALEGLTLADITDLAADFYVKEGDCGGGAPRFQISLDTNDDGLHDDNVFVYLGPSPSYTGCELETWESSGNLVDDLDLRWDTTQLGGTFYDSYANAVALAGDATVLQVSIVVDGAWALPDQRQVICVRDVEVNGMAVEEPFGAAEETELE